MGNLKTIKQSLRSQFREMEPGDVIHVSADDWSYVTVRSYASELSFDLQRRYSCKRDRVARIIHVTRLS